MRPFRFGELCCSILKPLLQLSQAAEATVSMHVTSFVDFVASSACLQDWLYQLRASEAFQGSLVIKDGILVVMAISNYTSPVDDSAVLYSYLQPCCCWQSEVLTVQSGFEDWYAIKRSVTLECCGTVGDSRILSAD